MIISHANNFVVIRVPRAAGTSLAFYFFKSGLIDPQTDVYKTEGSFSSWQEFDQYIATEGLEFANLPTELKSLENMASVRVTFDELVAKNAIPSDMPCVASIRNPLERIASAYSYVCKDMGMFNKSASYEFKTLPPVLAITNGITNINTFVDFILEHFNGAKPRHKWYAQSHYFPDHAEVFNIENLHQHASKFISEKGGVVSEPIELRRNTDIFTPDQTKTVFADLTLDRRQAMTDLFAKDFELWEKAYAVYN